MFTIYNTPYNQSIYSKRIQNNKCKNLQNSKESLSNKLSNIIEKKVAALKLTSKFELTDDHYREILDSLHHSNNKEFHSLLEQLGIKTVSKYSWFSSQRATGKIAALEYFLHPNKVLQDICLSFILPDKEMSDVEKYRLFNQYLENFQKNNPDMKKLIIGGGARDYKNNGCTKPFSESLNTDTEAEATYEGDITVQNLLDTLKDKDGKKISIKNKYDIIIMEYLPFTCYTNQAIDNMLTMLKKDGIILIAGFNIDLSRAFFALKKLDEYISIQNKLSFKCDVYSKTQTPCKNIYSQEYKLGLHIAAKM